jgi:hypothetical protein
MKIFVFLFMFVIGIVEGTNSEKHIDSNPFKEGIMNFRPWMVESTFFRSKWFPEEGLDINVRTFGPLYVNIGIRGGLYPEFYDDRKWSDSQTGLHLFSGIEIQYPLLKKEFPGLYGQLISFVIGCRFLEYIRYLEGNVSNHFGVGFYGGINILYFYLGAGYRIMTSEDVKDPWSGEHYEHDPSGFFPSLGIRFGF